MKILFYKGPLSINSCVGSFPSSFSGFFIFLFGNKIAVKIDAIPKEIRKPGVLMSDVNNKFSIYRDLWLDN